MPDRARQRRGMLDPVFAACNVRTGNRRRAAEAPLEPSIAGCRCIVANGVLTRTVRTLAAFYREVDAFGVQIHQLPPVGGRHKPCQQRLRIAVQPAPGSASSPGCKDARLLEDRGTRRPPAPGQFRDDFVLYWGSGPGASAVRPAHIWQDVRPTRLDELIWGKACHTVMRNQHRPAASRSRLRTLGPAAQRAVLRHHLIASVSTLIRPRPLRRSIPAYRTINGARPAEQLGRVHASAGPVNGAGDFATSISPGGFWHALRADPG